MKFDYDVIICGGGPGGSTCALSFFNTDIRVAVIEKNIFPRKKVCGDGLASYIPKTLGKISPVFANEFYTFQKKIPVSTFEAYSFNGTALTGVFPENWYCSPRYDFDEFLFQQASKLPNVTYLLGQQLRNIEITPEAVFVSTANNKKISGKMIIGCDGATSMTRRSLTNYEIEPDHNFATVRGYFSGVTDVNTDAYEIIFSKKYPYGYLWIFPSKGELTNVGIGIISSAVIDKKLKLREVLFEMLNESPVLKKRFEKAKLIGEIEGGGIPFGFGSFPISGDRFMLCGDAASLADPITGEGIGPAMVSGRIAAYQAIECCKKNDFSEKKMKNYDRAIKKKFGRLIKKRILFARIVSKNTWVLDKLFYLLNARDFFKSPTGKFLVKIFS